MDIKNFIFLFTLSMLVLLPSWGQTQYKPRPYAGFISYCKYASLDSVAEVKWLKFLLKTESCDELAEKMAKLKSFNEFKVPLEKSKPFKVASWTYEFPEIYGVKSKYDIKDVEKILKIDIDPEHFFTDLDPFREFKNLKILDFTSTQHYKRSLCTIAYSYKFSVDTIIIDWSSYEEAKKCDFYKMPAIIIDGDFVGGGRDKMAEHIIGIEHYVGSPDRIQSFPNLRFLGMTLNNPYSTIGAMVANQNITHLTLNYVTQLEDIDSLSELENLAYLAITCVDDELKHYREFNFVPRPCAKPILKDLKFLENLTWLYSLNLSYSGLENVDSLLKLEQLRSLDISHNRIKDMPDFSALKELKKLNIEGQE